MTTSRRLAGRLSVALVAVTLLALVGAALVLEAEAAQHEARPSSHGVLALGDSVPAGTACGCTPFPNEYGSLLRRRTGAAVSVDNEAAGGLDTAGLLAQLHEARTESAVRRSDVVLLTIGANDFADNHDPVVDGDCDPDAAADCVGDELDSMKAHLAEALAEIRTLRAGQPTSVLVTGYWNVFEDGKVAQDAAGATGLRASIRLTHQVNDAIRSVSTTAGAHYVNLFAPFQRRGSDIDSLLAPDGDHPDAAGHRLIASELLDAGLPRLS